jgi:ATP-binding cassette subfamily C protein CydCD
LRDALGQARLLDWGDGLPTGLDTPDRRTRSPAVGRAAAAARLARVLLADFPLVILNEQTAADLTRDLLSATERRTRVIIMHRPVEPGSVDQVLRLGLLM